MKVDEGAKVERSLAPDLNSSDDEQLYESEPDKMPNDVVYKGRNFGYHGGEQVKDALRRKVLPPHVVTRVRESTRGRQGTQGKTPRKTSGTSAAGVTAPAKGGKKKGL